MRPDHAANAKRITDAVTALGEHFDSVIVMACNDDAEHFEHHFFGVGAHASHVGLAQTFLMREQARANAILMRGVLQDDDEDED